MPKYASVAHITALKQDDVILDDSKVVIFDMFPSSKDLKSKIVNYRDGYLMVMNELSRKNKICKTTYIPLDYDFRIRQGLITEEVNRLDNATYKTLVRKLSKDELSKAYKGLVEF